MLDQLKPLMKNGERYILVEGGQPEYVLMRFSDYAAMTDGKRSNPGPTSEGARRGWGGVPAASAIELEEVRSVDPASSVAGFDPLPSDPATIRLEDLPL